MTPALAVGVLAFAIAAAAAGSVIAARTRRVRAQFFLLHDATWSRLTREERAFWLEAGSPPTWQIPDRWLAREVGRRRVREFRARHPYVGD